MARVICWPGVGGTREHVEGDEFGALSGQYHGIVATQCRGASDVLSSWDCPDTLHSEPKYRF